MYNAMTIVKYILCYYKNTNISINNAKLQKLLYFIQLECLRQLDQLCFYDKIEAWSHGPTIPSVYYKYILNSYHPIPVSDIDKTIDTSVIRPEFKKCIDKILNEYQTVKEFDMIRKTMCHSAWKNIYQEYKKNTITEPMLRIQARLDCNSV